MIYIHKFDDKLVPVAVISVQAKLFQKERYHIVNERYI